MSELAGVKVNLVETLDEAQTFLLWLKRQRRILAIDTETTGLVWTDPNFVRLVQFGDELEAWAVGAREWWQVIAEALDYVHESRQPVAMHNAKFDVHAIEVSGWKAPMWAAIHDTKIMDHLVYPIRSHALKRMGARRFGEQATVGEKMLRHTMSVNKWTWATVPVGCPEYWAYGCMDTVLTARFAIELGAELSERGLTDAYARESAAQAVIYRMEKRGLAIDTEYASALRDEWAEEKLAIQLQLHAWGVNNPNSKADVVYALKRKEGWEPEGFTDTGEPKLDKSILQGMDSQIAPLILRYKRIVKWTGAYLDHFIDGAVDGRVHPSINSMAARTGRMSIQNPALQTLPSKEASIRKCIVPDGPELWAVDYDAMELRVMASFSGDPGLLDMFRSGLDPHSQTAAMVYGLPYEDVLAGKHPVQRGTAKNTVFARIYGAGARTIAETAGVPEAQIQEFLSLYDNAFPGVDRFMSSVEMTAKSRLLNEGEAYVTTPYGRWLNAEADSIFKLVNYVIQGTCADLLKDKIVLLDKQGLGDHIMLPVHDEIILDCDEETAKEACILLEEHERFAVPLTASAEGPFNSWGQAKEQA